MWASAGAVEGNDSFAYLRAAQVFRSLDGAAVAALTPDMTPLYPVATALLSVATGEVTTAARAVSCLAGALTFAAGVALAWRFAGPIVAAVCALLLAVHPLLARLSVSALTESTYIAAAYVALWLFWAGHASPRPLGGAATGLVVGLAFIARLEGLLWAAALPAWQTLHFAFARSRAYDARQLVAWTLAFLAGFALLAAPQVWDVSRKMGSLSLNGRQAWSTLLVPRSLPSTEEAVYGLTYDPGTINLTRAHRDPQLRAELSNPRRQAVAYSKMAARNAESILFERIGKIAGPALLMAFGVGLLTLVGGGRRFAALLAVSFPAVALAAPLLQPALLDRHLAVVVPMLCVVAAIGFVRFGQTLRTTFGRRERGFVLLAAALAAAAGVVPRRDAMLALSGRSLYDEAAIQRVSAAISAAAREDRVRAPRVSARQPAVSFYAGAEWIPLPYTDERGLIRYLRLNNVQYLVVEHAEMRGRPFAPSFTRTSPPPEFEWLYRDADANGGLIDVYRFLPSDCLGAAVAQGSGGS